MFELPASLLANTAEQRGRRTTMFRDLARQWGKLERGDHVLVGSNRFPAIPANLDVNKRAVLIMLNKGLDDLSGGERPETLEVYELHIQQLADMRERVRRHLGPNTRHVAIPFDRERCERNAGNAHTREGSIEEHVEHRMLARARIAWV